MCIHGTSLPILRTLRLLPLLLLGHVTSLHAGEMQEEPAIKFEAKTFVFVCEDDSSHVLRTTENGVWLFDTEGTRKLPRVRSASGAKYSDGVSVIWTKGEEALLGKVGGKLRSCRNDRRRAIWEHAKLNGADFRAIGNEPGWTLEIHEMSRVILVSDYGASRVELALTEPVVDTGARSTRWDAGELTLELIGDPCNDSMSGEAFETKVVVTWQGKTLRGCGRALH
jgi:membrane-bound inhibitor of C-type lysozyme